MGIAAAWAISTFWDNAREEGSPTFAELFPGAAGLASLVPGSYVQQIAALFDHGEADPIVLDLSGSGVELTAQAGSNAYFDLYGNGFAVNTGWVGPETGILALDANGNGRIDDIAEVFGNATTDGFTALQSADDNGDGYFSTRGNSRELLEQDNPCSNHIYFNFLCNRLAIDGTHKAFPNFGALKDGGRIAHIHPHFCLG